LTETGGAPLDAGDHAQELNRGLEGGDLPLIRVESTSICDCLAARSLSLAAP